MKHVSKFDGCVYEISHSVGIENGKEYDDCVCLIWRDAPCGIEEAWDNDVPPREFINWYCGEYDYDFTEDYIKDYYKEKMQKKGHSPQKQPKTLDLPISYVHFIGDCLDVIEKHNLYALLSGYSHDENDWDVARSHLAEVVERLLNPLDEYGDDAKIILED